MINYGCNDLIAVISGGTSGIGLAVAENLLKDGAQVFILGRSEERGVDAVSKLFFRTQAKHRPTFIQCDVTSPASCKEVMERIKMQVNAELHIDILVNSAGVYVEERLERMTEASYAEIMDTNVKGTLLLTQAALPYMYAGGSIVNIASDAGISGNYGCPVYCASKGAVVALTKALALDLAPAIRVNCICPADVDTPLLERQLSAAEGSYNTYDMAASYPLERIGRPEEVAHVICAVVSPLNSFMTGSVIAVDGGLTAS